MQAQSLFISVQNLSSRTFNKSADCTLTTQLGKLFQIFTIRAKKKMFSEIVHVSLKKSNALCMVIYLR